MNNGWRILALGTVILTFLAAEVTALIIGANFGAEQPIGTRSDVTGAAGVFSTSNWNNLDGAIGNDFSLFDSSGALSGVGVSWSSSSTGDSSNNITAPLGQNYNLMTGHLGNPLGSSTVTFFNLPAGDYFVDIYINSDLNGLNLGGDYSVGFASQSHTDTTAFDGTFQQGSIGDYLRFQTTVGTNALSINASPFPMTSNFNAVVPINAIQIHQIPEVSSVVLVALSGFLALGLRFCHRNWSDVAEN